MKLHAKMILVTILLMLGLLADLVPATVYAQPAPYVTNGAEFIDWATPNGAEFID